MTEPIDITPRPWERFNYIGHPGGLCRIRGTKGVDGPLVECKEPAKRYVAECASDKDAAYIVLCVNAHERLVEAVSHLIFAVEDEDECPKCKAAVQLLSELDNAKTH
jgi:hypothetical protein